MARTKPLPLALGILTATGLLEGVRHMLMHREPMALFHVVSVGSTLLLVAMAAWQLETRTRLLEVSTRADDLAQTNERLRRALHELERSERLAAAGALTMPLCERLAELVAELRRARFAPAVLGQAEALLKEFDAWTQEHRRARRPADLAALVQYVVSEVVTSDSTYACSHQRVWVKADPARLELAVRRFVASAASRSAHDRLVVTVDQTESTASVVIAGPDQQPIVLDGIENLDWRVARAVIAECGGAVEMSDTPSGALYRLHLPVGPTPDGTPQRERPAYARKLARQRAVAEAAAEQGRSTPMAGQHRGTQPA